MKNVWMIVCAGLLILSPSLRAQDPLSGLIVGEGVPPELETMYSGALAYLAATQTPKGNWPDNYGSQPGVVGVCVLAFLASGEDPNHGPFRTTIRRAAEYIVSQQDAATGYIGNSMYNHGFATLALAELYGHLREPDVSQPLKRAVDLILKSQEQNPLGGWRYSPTAKDADTTVSGAQMVALFAARNAGLEVPDKAFERGLAYFKSCMEDSGGVGYTNRGGGNATRTAITSLAYSLYNDYESDASKKMFDYVRKNRDASSGYIHYHFYYMAQALFQGDMDEWRVWNRKTIELFKATQQENGAWNGQQGPAFSTGAALLSMALNYRMMPIYER
jgi:hypothetical protein